MFSTWKTIINKPLKYMDVIISLTVIGITFFLICYWKYIPEQVPQHWNFAGQIDDYADSGSYIFLVIMMYFFYAWHLMSKLIPTFDLKENLFGKELIHKVTKEVEHKVINILFGMLWSCDLILQLTFAYIIVCGVFVRNLGIWFLPLVFILLTGDFIWFAFMMVKARKSVL